MKVRAARSVTEAWSQVLLSCLAVRAAWDLCWEYSVRGGPGREHLVTRNLHFIVIFFGGAFFPCLRAIAAPFRLSESPKLPRRLGPGHAGAKRGNFLGAPHTRRAPHRKTLKKRVFRVFSVSNRCVGPAASGAPKMPKFGIRAAHTRSFAAHLGSEVVPRCFKKLPLAPTPSTNPSGFRVGLRGGAGWVGLGW